MKRLNLPNKLTWELGQYNERLLFIGSTKWNVYGETVFGNEGSNRMK